MRQVNYVYLQPMCVNLANSDAIVILKVKSSDYTLQVVALNDSTSRHALLSKNTVLAYL